MSQFVAIEYLLRRHFICLSIGRRVQPWEENGTVYIEEDRCGLIYVMQANEPGSLCSNFRTEGNSWLRLKKIYMICIMHLL